MSLILSFFRKQYVFCISTLCALLSCFFVPPSLSYLSYIDWNSLALLFALMAVVSGFEKCGLFLRLGNFLTSLVHDARSLSAVLIALCFVSSMLITNDVALLTFVPFSVMLFEKQKHIPSWCLLYVVVLQTVAANTGSMLTPVGNPQNIFLFSKMGESIPSFMGMILPYSAVCAIILMLLVFAVPKIKLEKLRDSKGDEIRQKTSFRRFKGQSALHSVVYALLFLLCLVSVAGIVPKLALVPVVIFVIFVFDRSVLASVDYWLLLTFCSFFVFSGNIALIPAVSEFLVNAVGSHEFLASVVSSQIISNVPATLLLYPFVSDVKGLLLGVNAGGLGTLVASLASLISFKLYTKGRGGVAKYLAVFSAINFSLLALLCILYFLKVF